MKERERQELEKEIREKHAELIGQLDYEGEVEVEDFRKPPGVLKALSTICTEISDDIGVAGYIARSLADAEIRMREGVEKPARYVLKGHREAKAIPLKPEHRVRKSDGKRPAPEDEVGMVRIRLVVGVAEQDAQP